MTAATVEALARASADDLFSVLGLEVVSTGADVAPGEMMALVAFVHPKLKGCFLLEVSRSVFSARQSASHSEGLGEVANQLMGRLKNRLLVYGVEVNASLPVLVQGKHLEPILPGDAAPLTWAFTTGQATLWLQVSLAGELVEGPATAIESLGEGTGVLF